MQGQNCKKSTALQREISERERAEAAHARLTAILEATPDIVISAHTNGTAFYLNYAARDILGLNDGADISGLKLLDVQPDWARKIVMEVGFRLRWKTERGPEKRRSAIVTVKRFTFRRF